MEERIHLHLEDKKINSDEDAANAELEDGPITASNNITNGSKDDLPPSPPPPMPSKVTKAKPKINN